MTTPTTPGRFDLFRVPHKGIRKLMFDTALAMGATDFTDAAEAARASAAMQRMIGFCAEHLEHEDRVVMPALQRIAPAVHRRLEQGHREHDAAFEELRELTARIASGAPLERWAAGERLNRVLHVYIAEDLAHMAIEETEAMEAFWAHLTDAELAAMHAGIVAAIPPPRMGEWCVYILPAQSLPERAALVGAFLAAPPPVFDALTGPGRAALGEATWEKTLAAARAVAEQGRAAA